MPTFRKKPVEIEAREWNGSNAADLLDWINEHAGSTTASKSGSSLIIPTP